MPLFQASVLKKYISQLDKPTVQKAYKKYCKFFHDAKTQENIRNSKEEQFQEGFLRELFVDVLGYTLNPTPKFNLTTELKNLKGAKKVDGAILKDDKALAVIELKGTNTKDLESIRQQAFDYKANQIGCIYVITSNFEKLRFYINNAVDFEEFNLFTLTEAEFELFYLCLAKDNLLANKPLSIKEASIVEEENITKKFYGDYSVFKRELFRDLVKQNMKNETFRELNEKNVKLTLFKKSQKLIDRFLFILFAEDRGLLAPNSISTILGEWKALEELDMVVPLYDRYKQYFSYLDTGRKGTDKKEEIFAYNGGLFQPDALLDAMIIDDDLLYKHTKKLTTYDFQSQVDVNILGHIFEHSLNEIESVNAEIEGTDFDKQKTKRKKDGVFYTPKYITKYIVDNTIGKLCTDKKQELGIIDEEYAKGRKNRQATTIVKLDQQLKDYRDWLLQLTICDPACGSGAFLNQALDFLIREHSYIDELNKQLFGGFFVFPDIENQILEHNIFGVDLNDESVEIAKLSLWLRTAQPKRKLTSLNNNIKCGNSLIDIKTIAGDKAFNWQENFPEVFEQGGFDVIIGNPPYVQLQSMGSISDDLQKMKYETFEKTSDLYCLFHELGNIILKEKGLLGFITSNKWLRANYGKSLRNYLIENTQPIELIDLGSGIFDSATVDSNILIFKKSKTNNKSFIGLDISKVKTFIDFNIYENLKVEIKPIKNDIWTISNPTETKIKAKIEAIGTPLKDWNIKINYGIKTGFNDAFIIDENTKNELLFKDSKNTEIIHPILRGRDINRYISDYQNLYLINAHNGYGGIPEINLENYPTIKEHLDKYYAQLEKRGDKGKTPYNLRNCAYVDDFFNENLFYPDICQRLSFTKVNSMFSNNTGYYLKTSDSYFLSILNSNLINYYYKKISAQLGESGIRSFTIYIENIPIPKITDFAKQPFIEKADLMLSLNKDLQEQSKKFQRTIQRKFNLEDLPKKLQDWYLLSYSEFIKELAKKKVKLTLSEEAEWEDYFEVESKKAQALKAQIDKTDKEIDQMVYELYGLSEEEIKIVEGIDTVN